MTIAAVVKDFKFIGAGGKLYLWDGASTVITFDIATMGVSATNTYGFTITDIACDDTAYYIGQNGDANTDTPMQVHRISIAGEQTTYTGNIDWTEPRYYYRLHGSEHYVDFLYATGGKLFISCGGNAPDSSPYTVRWLTEVNTVTMTRDCRMSGDTSSAPSTIHGFSDFVTDGTYLYALLYASWITKFTIGTMVQIAQNSGNIGPWNLGYGMVYTQDGYILRTRGNRGYSTVEKYHCTNLAKTNLGQTYGGMGFYHAVSDGSTIWFDWYAFDILSATTVSYPIYPGYKLFSWEFSSSENAIWFQEG